MDVTALSVFALWTATVLYAIAMVAYSVRLAKVADVATERRRAASPQPVHAKGAGTTKVRNATRPGPTTNGPSDAARVAAKSLGIGRSATLVGLAVHAVGVTARGIDAGHVPWSNMYEFSISGSLVAVAVFLLVQRVRDVAYLAPGVTGLSTVTLGLALTVMYREVTGLQPALQSFWLVIHVAVAVIATGVLIVGAVASVMQLLQHAREAGSAKVASARWRWLEAVPGSQELEALAFRVNAVGFVLWTFTVMAGAVWAEHAWGRYWGWDPKEVWSFVIWVIYAAYLHARTTQGWSGRRAAWLSLVGFVAVIMNFTVVNLVFQGLHSYGSSS
jgi:cytochrome c-type biogenesis protein CcsB